MTKVNGTRFTYTPVFEGEREETEYLDNLTGSTLNVLNQDSGKVKVSLTRYPTAYNEFDPPEQEAEFELSREDAIAFFTETVRMLESNAV